MIKAISLTAAIFFAATVSGNAYTILKTQSTTTGFEFTIECEDGRILHPRQMSGNIIHGGIYDSIADAMKAANCK